MLKISNIVLDSMQVKEMTEFYKQVFEKDPDMLDEGMAGWYINNIMFAVGEHSEMTGKAKEPARILINFEADDVKNEFERIKSIPGAEVIKEPYEMEGMSGMWIATFADPDGNFFQLMPPWKE